MLPTVEEELGLLGQRQHASLPRRRLIGVAGICWCR